MEQLFKDFLTEISPALQNLLVLLALFVIGQASEFITKQRAALKAKLSADQQLLLDILAERAVQVIEQIYYTDSNDGKRNRAIAMISAELSKAGIKVDLNVIVNAIEAQVFKKNQALPQG